MPLSLNFGRKASSSLFFHQSFRVLKGLSISHSVIQCSTFSSSLPVTMFDSTVDLITQATSSSLFIFCFCNLIIAVLLLGSLKPSSYSDQETAIPFLVVTNVNKNDKAGGNAENSFKERRVSVDAEKGMVENGKEDGSERKDDEDNSQEEDEEVEEEDDGDELRRRVEEFIEKINRGWKAEMLRTSLAQTEQLQTRLKKIHAV